MYVDLVLEAHHTGMMVNLLRCENSCPPALLPFKLFMQFLSMLLDICQSLVNIMVPISIACFIMSS